MDLVPEQSTTLPRQQRAKQRPARQWQHFRGVSDNLVPRQSWPEERPRQVSVVGKALLQLRERLWHDLALPALQPRADAKHQNIIDIYSQSQDRIEKYRKEANQLLEIICMTNVVGQQNSRALQAALLQEVRKLFQDVRLPQLQVDKRVGANLGGHDVASAYQVLVEALDSALDGFLMSFADSLAKLLGSKVVGSITWTNASMCQFSFAIREIRQQANTRVVRHENDIEIDRFWTTETMSYVTSEWRIEHHLMRSQVTNDIELPRKSPPRAMQLWKSIPAWLREHVGVVEGDLFRKQALEIAKWEDTVVQETYHEEVAIVGDPAITLFDQIVLTGWDESEMNQKKPAVMLSTFDLGMRNDDIMQDNDLSTTELEAASEFDPITNQELPEPRHEISPQTEEIGYQFVLLVVPFFLSGVCAIWFPGAFALPVLAAVGVLALWGTSLRKYAASFGHETNTEFRKFALCSMLFACCGSVLVPYTIVTQSFGTLAVSVFSVLAATTCWVWARNLLDVPPN